MMKESDDTIRVSVVPTPDEIFARVRQEWVEMATAAIDERDCFTAGLSGGKSPAPLYALLAREVKAELWAKTHLFLADERFVPAEHQDSNNRLVRETLAVPLQAVPRNFHPIDTSQESADHAARKYEGELKAFFQIPESGCPQFDLILLGLGEDGHTASLFTGMDIDPPDRIAIPAKSKYHSHERISLTLSVLNTARHIFFIVYGANKAEVVQAVLKARARLPATQVKPSFGRVHYFLDKAAASALRP